MFEKVKILGTAAAVSILIAGSASALTVTQANETELDPYFDAQLDGETISGPWTFDYYLHMTATPGNGDGDPLRASGYIELSFDGAWAFFFDDFSSNRAGAQSGLTVDLIDGFGGAVLNRLSTVANGGATACNGGYAPIAGECLLLTGGTPTGVQIGEDTDLTGMLSGGSNRLGAGVYRIGWYEGNNDPTTNTATFGISAVPVPAAGFLLLGALGGLGLARRRRKS